MTSLAEQGDAVSERVAAMRLRSERPRVTRLSRKVLAGGTAIGMITLFGAALWALQTNRTQTVSSDELYSTDHHNIADGLSGLPQDYAGGMQCAPGRGIGVRNLNTDWEGAGLYPLRHCLSLRRSIAPKRARKLQ